MGFDRKIGGFRVLPALGALLIGAAACSSGVSGSATTEGYQPLEAAAIQIDEVEFDQEIIGVAPDLSHVVEMADGKICLVSLDDTAGPGSAGTGARETGSAETGAADTEPGEPETVCADLPDGARPASAVFAPNGEHYALFPDVRMFDDSGAWIVQSATGEAVPVEVSGAFGPTGSAGSGAESPETNSTPSAGSEPSGSQGTDNARLRNMLQGGVWLSNDELIGFGTQEVVRIDVSTGKGTSLYVVPDELIWMYAVGGRTAVVLVETELTAIDLDTGEVSEPVAVADKGVRASLLGVSPDGTTALVSRSDARTMEVGPTVLVSLEDGRQTDVDVPDETMVFAGGFSPDGSQIVLFRYGGPGQEQDDDGDTSSSGTEGAESTAGTGESANGEHGEGDTRIQLLAADGTDPRTIGSSDAYAFGPITWSRSDVLFGDAFFARPLVAWQLSAGN